LTFIKFSKPDLNKFKEPHPHIYVSMYCQHCIGNHAFICFFILYMCMCACDKRSIFCSQNLYFACNCHEQ